jgi:hypothetical protein
MECKGFLSAKEETSAKVSAKGPMMKGKTARVMHTRAELRSRIGGVFVAIKARLTAIKSARWRKRELE